MKKIFVIVGFLITVGSLFALFQHALNYSELSSYGKGYIWGKILILLLGILLLFLGIRKKKTSS